MGADWERLEHHGGNAGDTPRHLQNLRSSNESTRRQAALVLHATLYAPGAFYNAAAQAVPQLVELLLDPDTPDRHRIAYLLANIVAGHQRTRLHAGVDLDDALVRDAYLAEPAATILREVTAAAPAIAALVTDDDAPTRARVATLLAFVPGAAWASLARLRAQLEVEDQPIVRATEIVAAGYLVRASRDAGMRERLEMLVQDGPDALARGAALVGRTLDRERPVTDPPATVIRELLLAGNQPDRLFPFNEGKLVAFASARIAAMGDVARDRVADALVDAVHATGTDEHGWLGVLLPLLFVTAGNPPDLSTLSSAQMRALERTVKLPVTSNVFLKWGVPADPVRRQKWLGAARPA